MYKSGGIFVILHFHAVTTQVICLFLQTNRDFPFPGESITQNQVLKGTFLLPESLVKAHYQCSFLYSNIKNEDFLQFLVPFQ